MARPGRAVPSCAGRMTICSMLASTCVADWPGRPATTSVRRRSAAPRPESSWRVSAGRRSSPRFSASADPSALTTKSGCRRTACSSPTGPAKPDASSSSGSATAPATQRTIRSIGIRPCSVLSETRSPVDAQVSAFHEQQPEIAREVGVAEEIVVARAPASAGRWSGRRDRRAARATPAAAGRTAPAAEPCRRRRCRPRRWCAPCGWRARSRCRPASRCACRSRASARPVRARCRWRRTG